MFITLVSIWAVLMIYSALTEMKYYQAVKTFEPKVWESLGTPSFFKTPLIFLNSKNKQILAGITNETIQCLSAKNRHARFLFLSYVVLVLAGCIIYFKLA